MTDLKSSAHAISEASHGVTGLSAMTLTKASGSKIVLT